MNDPIEEASAKVCNGNQPCVVELNGAGEDHGFYLMAMQADDRRVWVGTARLRNSFVSGGIARQSCRAETAVEPAWDLLLMLLAGKDAVRYLHFQTVPNGLRATSAMAPPLDAQS